MTLYHFKSDLLIWALFDAYGALILDTVYGEVKIGVHRDGAGYACEVLRELKEAAK